MKKLTLSMLIMLIATLSFAQKMQDTDVPANVKSTIQQKYPAAKKVNWDKEGDHYEASFDLNKTDNSVLMDAQGNIIEIEVEIELTELPKGTLDYVTKNYPGKKPKEGAKITDAKGIVTFEVEIKGIDLIFDSNGKFIKEIKE